MWVCSTNCELVSLYGENVLVLSTGNSMFIMLYEEKGIEEKWHGKERQFGVLCYGLAVDSTEISCEFHRNKL